MSQHHGCTTHPHVPTPWVYHALVIQLAALHQSLLKIDRTVPARNLNFEPYIFSTQAYAKEEDYKLSLANKSDQSG